VFVPTVSSSDSSILADDPLPALYMQQRGFSGLFQGFEVCIDINLSLPESMPYSTRDNPLIEKRDHTYYMCWSNAAITHCTELQSADDFQWATADATCVLCM